MFLKSLTIYRQDGTSIRDIHFRPGINLIVDETHSISGKETGNNVGKTTVIKLVDVCLGANPKEIYIDPENRRIEYKLVKDFLKDQKIRISLILTDDLTQEDSLEIRIDRNFLTYKNKIQRINGENKSDDEFDETLTNLLFPGHYGKKPTFRQIISHNIRYKELSVNNTLKTLDSFTRDDEYETLYLFLLGCDFEKGNIKQELRTQINIEEKFKTRLESEQTKSAYESANALLLSEINELEEKKSSLNLNPDFESDLESLNDIKYKINHTTSVINRLEIRKRLILEAQTEIQSGETNINLNELKHIYTQATSLVSNVQKTFEELVLTCISPCSYY